MNQIELFVAERINSDIGTANLEVGLVEQLKPLRFHIDCHNPPRRTNLAAHPASNGPRPGPDPAHTIPAAGGRLAKALSVPASLTRASAIRLSRSLWSAAVITYPAIAHPQRP